jgi:hypothetical protein
MGDPRRSPALQAIVLTLAVAAVAIALSRGVRPAERLVTLGVGEVVQLDRREGIRWRLMALSTDRDGLRTLHLKSLDGGDVSATLPLREGTPLRFARWELNLRDVCLDPARGTAVQLQWIPRDSTGGRPLFSVTDDEPVPVPADIPVTLQVDGVVPPPTGGILTLVIRREREAPVTARLERGGRLPLGRDGELAWLGTSERWLTTIGIRAWPDTPGAARGIIPRS